MLDTKEKGHLSISQRQAIIKFIKKDRDKRFIKNWCAISLLNVDLKIISQALSEKPKKVLPHLINLQQTAYARNSHVSIIIIIIVFSSSSAIHISVLIPVSALIFDLFMCFLLFTSMYPTTFFKGPQSK